MASVNALELLKGLSVEEIDRQIAELTDQLELLKKQIGGQIAGLKVLRQAAALHQNGEPDKGNREITINIGHKQPAPKPFASPPDDRTRAILERPVAEEAAPHKPRPKTIAEKLTTYLERCGKAKPVVMAEDMELNRDSVFSTISQHKELFEPMGDGYWKLRGSKVA